VCGTEHDDWHVGVPGSIRAAAADRAQQREGAVGCVECAEHHERWRRLTGQDRGVVGAASKLRRVLDDRLAEVVVGLDDEDRLARKLV
jgi:hypothetical protein